MQREVLRKEVSMMKDVYDEDIDVKHDKYRIEGKNEIVVKVLDLLK